MTTYRNPWHTPGKPHYGPAEYQTEARPTEYRGFLIYRRMQQCFDVVRGGTCCGQYAGLSGAKGLVDLIHDQPEDFWAARAVRYLQSVEA